MPPSPPHPPPLRALSLRSSPPVIFRQRAGSAGRRCGHQLRGAEWPTQDLAASQVLHRAPSTRTHHRHISVPPSTKPASTPPDPDPDPLNPGMAIKSFTGTVISSWNEAHRCPGCGGRADTNWTARLVVQTTHPATCVCLAGRGGGGGGGRRSRCRALAQLCLR